MLLANKISVFFNRQYFINGLTSDFDFRDVDRHEWKKQAVLTDFLEKIFLETNGPFLAQKWHVLRTLDHYYGIYTLLSHTKIREKVLLLTFNPEKFKINESTLEEMVRMRQESVFSWPYPLKSFKSMNLLN